jgi:uncharacterized membrane protein YebE (DUF533 family)
MLFIWGFKGRSKKQSDGQFYCPDCGDYRMYFLMMVKRWFTFYFIPIFPTSTLGEYVECQTCKSTFNEQVLKLDPKGDHERFEAEFSIATKRVMFKIALADGDIDEREIEQITQAFQNITKREIDRADIAAELEAARDDTRTVADYITEVAAKLNDTGKETVLRAAIAVVKADGVIDGDEIVELQALVKALDMPRAYSNGILLEEGLNKF